MDVSRVLVVGDSWASAHEQDTGNQNAGWPEFLGIPGGMRQAKAGAAHLGIAGDISENGGSR